MKNLINSSLKHIEKNKRTIGEFLAYSILVLLMILLQHYLQEFIVLIPLTLLVFIITILWVVVTYIVGKVIFDAIKEIATELSLLLFISYSFCEITNTTVVSAESENAMEFIIGFGLLFALWRFLTNIYRALRSYLQKIKEKDDSDPFGYWFIVLLVLSITAFFLHQIYLAMQPLLNNICFL